MNITELIRKHEPNPAEQFVLREFTIELLELVKAKARACQQGNLDVGLSHVRAIDKALDELRK